ncbi:unnamed protein product [Symbiodinium necroappetens]|uniref:Uncharacterized protein n=1 Tax=Symbiodinium necroappetens TaxID=1628268 RepID=A0A812ND98_9DINO|nr:unnamed protein product [Symbiodinium necroappetens]
MAAEEEVEQQLVEAISQEVALELSTPSGNSANKFRCCFCPFRSCGRADRLGKHIRKFHAKERLFTANGRTQAQWNLVLAMFEQEQATGNFLQRSAAQLQQWIAPDPLTLAYLSKHNDIDVVLLLTSQGPTYVLKAQTVNSRRLHKNLYYDHSFASLLLSLMLQHAGKSEPVFNGVVHHFVQQQSPCVLLGLRNRLTRRRLMEDVAGLPCVQSLREGLVDTCTRQGEWHVVTHDATFKSLFSILGQEKMGQKDGEVHALHSVLGRSGALAGLTPQRTEGLACFQAACEGALPRSARETTKWIFSDTPASVEGCRRCFPNLVGVAEDPLHLVFRVEACFGERRTALSRDVLRLQKKFAAPELGPIYNGGPPEPGRWCGQRKRARALERDWECYCAQPYQRHQDYVDDILDICLTYPSDMSRKDSRGKTTKQILIAGASFQHFAYLLNGSRARASLSDSDRKLLSMGTAANEALHQQFNATQRPVIQQHRESVDVVLFSFTLAKLLAHQSAAYWPTVSQRSQSLLLSMITGHLRREFCPAFAKNPVAVVRNRRLARAPVHRQNPAAARAAADRAAGQSERWATHVAARKVRRRWILKRTVFTKKKQKRQRRGSGKSPVPMPQG